MKQESLTLLDKMGNITKTKLKVLAIGLGVFALAFLSFRPIINLTLEDCEKMEGPMFEAFISPKNGDVYFQLSNSDKHFRINNGKNAGISQSMLDSMAEQQIVIYLVNHWTLLDTQNNYPHVAQLEWKGKVIYSEF